MNITPLTMFECKDGTFWLAKDFPTKGIVPAVQLDKDGNYQKHRGIFVTHRDIPVGEIKNIF